MGSERRVRIGEEIGRRHSARLVTLLVRQTPALFHNEAEGSRWSVHGDDFFVAGVRQSLDRLGQTLPSKYSMRKSHRLGSAHLPNRIVCRRRSRRAARQPDRTGRTAFGMRSAQLGAPWNQNEIVVLIWIQVRRQGTDIEKPRRTIKSSGNHSVQVVRHATCSSGPRHC